MRSGQELLREFSDFLGDYHVGNATSAGGASGVTIVDTALRAFGDDTLIDRWFRISDPDSNDVWEVQRATDFDESTGTVTVAPGYGNIVAQDIEYEMHRYEPSRKFRALDRARLLAFPQVSRILIDDTLTGDGENREFLVPSDMSKGPVAVFQESPFNSNPGWNLLNSQENTDTSAWTASNFVATTVARQVWFPTIPKYDQNATELTLAASTAGTYSQSAAAMRQNVTASSFAGRTMTYVQWVYCDTPNRVRVELVDDNGATTSNAHRGRGWQLLSVTKRISDANSTTFTAQVVGDSGSTAITVFLNRGLLGALHRIPQLYPTLLAKEAIFRPDDGPATVLLKRAPGSGYQLRFVGRDLITPLGRNIDRQTSNVMEVDEGSQELLFAKAARILYAENGLTEDNMQKEFQKIQEVEQRFAEMAADHSIEMPVSQWVELA